MIELHLSDEELERMKLFLLDELAKAEQQQAHVRTTLDTIQTHLPEVPLTETQPLVGKSKRRRFRYPERFIVQLLGQEQRLLSSKELANAAIFQYDFPPKKKPETEKKIRKALEQLEEEQKTHSLNVPGRKALFYGLPEWFDEQGEVKATFIPS